MAYWALRGIIKTFTLLCMIFLMIIIMIIRKLEMEVLVIVDTTLSYLLKDLDSIDDHFSAIKTTTSFHQRTTEKSMISFIFDFRYMPFFSHNTVILPGGFDQFYEFLLDNSDLTQSELHNMHFEINRLKSFESAPELNVYFTKLAANGFYYDSIRKTCRCVFCDFEKEVWDSSDNVSEVHQRCSSSCPFINNTHLSENIPIHSRNPYLVSQAVAQHGYASSCQHINHRRVSGRSLHRQTTDTHNQSAELQPTTDTLALGAIERLLRLLGSRTSIYERPLNRDSWTYNSRPFLPEDTQWRMKKTEGEVNQSQQEDGQENIVQPTQNDSKSHCCPQDSRQKEQSQVNLVGLCEAEDGPGEPHRDQNTRPLCIYCQTNEPSVTFDCGHCVACELCAVRIEFCPRCDKKIIKTRTFTWRFFR